MHCGARVETRQYAVTLRFVGQPLRKLSYESSHIYYYVLRTIGYPINRLPEYAINYAKEITI